MAQTHAKSSRCAIDGILLLDKPIGLSSNQALQKVKRLLNARKAGHTGSLDPLATGMLPICLGQATKFSQYLLDAHKCYSVRVKLGVRTTTSDAEGEVVSERDVPKLEREALDRSLDAFRGVINQVPSMFSALKHNGVPLYKLARQGLTVPRKSRQITLFELTLGDIEVDEVTLDLHCSKGTYVRTLVDDWGELLGCGAHVIELRRTVVGVYPSSMMVSMDQVEEQCEQDSQQFLSNNLLSLSSSVDHLPRCEVAASDVAALLLGQTINQPAMSAADCVSLYGPKGFVGVGKVSERGVVAVNRLLRPSGLR